MFFWKKDWAENEHNADQDFWDIYGVNLLENQEKQRGTGSIVNYRV